MIGRRKGGVLGSWISSNELGGRNNNEVNIAHAVFVHWCNGDSIETDTFAMMVDVVGTHDGSELIVHGMSDLLAHRTLSNVVSNEALGNLMARELFAESKVSSTISEVSIAITMDRV
jgi:hypothetical protein